MRILITGGAGFVGSTLARAFASHDPQSAVVVFDNLRRRGAETNLPLLRRAGVRFVHGDVRQRSDLEDLAGNFDLLIEASAEPSVLAGLDGSPSYVLQTNLAGMLNCLEFVRKRCGALLFLSSSRVYSIAPLRGLALKECPSRFELEARQPYVGTSEAGISEEFPTHLPRSFYGASKLASEYVLQEYADALHVKALVNRCGVIAGPGQFGRVEQGVFTLWVVNHYFGRPLRYTGFNGSGKQVRDLLDPLDLYDLIQQQLAQVATWSGNTFNVGGGKRGSVSLLELTALCRAITGREVPIERVPESTAVDIPYYVSDHHKASETFGWQPRMTPEAIVHKIAAWLRENETQMRAILLEDG